MPLIPETYRHNISLLVDQHKTDASRIIDIGADAIFAARRALSSMPDIAVGDIFDDIRPLHALIDAVSNRCVLDPQFDEIVDDLLEALPNLDADNPLASSYASIRADLQEAQYFANRFLDIIHAEKRRAQSFREM
ncbi:hypothetical protein SAMN04515647_1818 [Cohaesibacter sp. ES.047]|uniref:hypothetical protein n=1 Tax=Cohaesibacter sp. ES.047 TaxID=1798205 RepID=UPI000BB86EA5|nr:hypothetical protein [Cohaesibacter sp. ES.047]SNY91589.1 hypothetical protein SAMN04515647_1818 [Cohaesibacter sp. ES.047]